MAQSIKDITKAVATVAVKESMAMVRIVVAVIAAPTQKKSFRHLPHSSTWSLTTSYSLQLVQASYRTAVDTDKMRMVVFFTCMSVCGFETADVISWPGSPSQASLGQVIQITDDRGFVDAIGC